MADSPKTFISQFETFREKKRRANNINTKPQTPPATTASKPLFRGGPEAKGKV